MKCPHCNRPARKFGTFKSCNGTIQRYQCVSCRKTFRPKNPLGDLRIPDAKAVEVLGLLVEGVGINAASRLAHVHKENRTQHPVAGRRTL